MQGKQQNQNQNTRATPRRRGSARFFMPGHTSTCRLLPDVMLQGREVEGLCGDDIGVCGDPGRHPAHSRGGAGWGMMIPTAEAMAIMPYTAPDERVLACWSWRHE